MNSRGDQITLVTAWVWVVEVARQRRRVESQTRTVLSFDPDTRRLLSGFKW